MGEGLNMDDYFTWGYASLTPGCDIARRGRAYGVDDLFQPWRYFLIARGDHDLHAFIWIQRRP